MLSERLETAPAAPIARVRELIGQMLQLNLAPFYDMLGQEKPFEYFLDLPGYSPAFPDMSFLLFV